MQSAECAEVKSLLNLGDCITVVEEAFKAHALGQKLAPGLLHVDAAGGEFHIKAVGVERDLAFTAT